MTEPGISDEERAMLDIERKWWRYKGRKEQAIRDELGMSETEFYLRLNHLIDTERALAHDPLTTKRLLRLRAERQRSRSARRLGL